jgi:hypothetical protein
MYSATLTPPKPENKKVKDFKEYAKLYLELALCFSRVTRVTEVINNLKGITKLITPFLQVRIITCFAAD